MELSLFSFRPAGGPLARMPAGVKLLAVFSAIAGLFHVTLAAALALCPLLALLSAALGFSPASQLRDLRPVLAYLALYYLAAVVINAVQSGGLSSRILVPPEETLLSILRLLLSVQLASLLYKSTTAIQIRGSLQVAEGALRRALRSIPPLGGKVSPTPSATFSLALAISFIPRIMALWNQLERSWRARGGRPGVPMARALLPQLLALAFQDAEDTWRAIASREQAEGRRGRARAEN